MDNIGINVSRETIDAFYTFERLVKKWNPAINLVAKNEITSLWQRHILDSAQLYQYAPNNVEKWVDIGSGGGFPGIIMGIIAKEKHPETEFTLIESDQRKSAFLRNAARELDLKIKVVSDRVEETTPMNADVLTARALKPLDTLIPFILRHVHEKGLAILPKGRNWAGEIQQAQANWRFEVEAHASITDSEARVLIVNEIARD